MNTFQLRALLDRLSGHLVVESPQQEKQLKRLHQALARSYLPEEAGALRGSRFAFEDADLFSPEEISAERAAALQTLAERKGKSRAAPDYRVFVREVPVRSTQLHASVPLWAGGAAVDQTIGPFTHKDGRVFWFDFFKIEKLVALYIQGDPNPVLLFRTSTGVKLVGNQLIPIRLLRTYKLSPGSIWIHSPLLAANAPAGYYTGLRIKGGTLTLSAAPQTVNGKLTISPNTTATVNLQLQQPPAQDADPSSPYGADARAAELDLPQTLAFHFSGQGRTLDQVSAAEWSVYGHQAAFEWNAHVQPAYDNVLHRVLIPFQCSAQTFAVSDCESPFHTLEGDAPITTSAWALPAAPIDVTNPIPAAGIGGLVVRCAQGLTTAWSGLQGGALNLNAPYVMAEPGRVALTDLTAGNVFCWQEFEMWKDEANPYGARVQVQYPSTTPFYYNTFAHGAEALMILADADVQADRPVTVSGTALAIRSKNSVLLLAATKAFKLVYLFDDNILFDSSDLQHQPPILPQPISLALRNALFKVTPVNGCLLAGLLADDFVKIEKGFLFLTFGLLAYLPTLPDPYAANLGGLRSQFRRARSSLTGGQNIWAWLVCLVQWMPDVQDKDHVEVSFHFAPLQSQTATLAVAASPMGDSPFSVAPEQSSAEPTAVESAAGERALFASAAFDERLPNYGEIWDGYTHRLQQDLFALLDVSTNADLLGISFSMFGDRRMVMVRTHEATAANSSAAFPIQVQGMDVVSAARNVNAFTVPQISWEPVVNLTPPAVQGDPSGGFNYYPDDGGPTRIINNSAQQVALAPLPLTDFVVNAFDDDDKFAALALFTLPFGMKALGLLKKEYEYQGAGRRGTQMLLNAKAFENDVNGARQIQVDAGAPLVQGESDMFMGSTIQLNNVLEWDGSANGNSTLGRSVTKIFNNEFLLEPFDLLRQRGVPLTRMDLSGYGASIFSNWLNPKAPIAATSQAKFDVFVGRCAHEIIQVKSILYPWAIKVVRTITLFRTASGYVYRYDSGWRAESEGKFDFTYYVNVDDPQNPGQLKPAERQAAYEIHPGIVKRLTNVKEIKETDAIAPVKGQLVIPNNGFYVDEDGKEQKNTSGANMFFNFELQPVFFNADVEIENPISGFVTKTIGAQQVRVCPSKRILGFVQIAPRGMPLTTQALQNLITSQLGSIGGPLDCVVNIASSGQQMRLNRFDVSNSFGANGSDPIFVAAGRGNVILPKDGSWSMVKHERGTGEVTPVPQELSIPLIRIGKLIKQAGEMVPDLDPATQLLRIADPTEILRAPVNTTLNYGFLHSTDTQKALFLTPAYKQGLEQMLSKTPPLFADAFRIVNSKGIFPNIGDAENTFGDVISLYKNGNEFVQNALVDGGKQVLELMKIDEVVNNVKQEGYKLLRQVQEFDLPNSTWTLIEVGGAFKIYIEYKRTTNAQTNNGKLGFDVDSFTNSLADRWKSRMANVGLVVDLGPIKRLMTIKGNWDAKNGAEAQYRGSDTDPTLPSPQIEFAPELKPVIEILQILQDLQGENYKDAFQRGLKLAMSNKAGTWEYKLEASKEIPVVRFPTPAFLYNDPNAPLKLEAGLKLGAYFNAALKVTTDPKQLLPTAGAFLGFYGRLSVMCVSLSIATVYAVGQVNLDIAADTKIGPSLKMKFGFGAQIVVGLPVVGNVSVLYMVGVEIYTDSTKVVVSAFLLFQGHAELLGGIVGVTITIEAKGTVSRANDRTDLAAQVTFALDISIFLVIDISFSTSWQEQRQIA